MSEFQSEELPVDVLSTLENHGRRLDDHAKLLGQHSVMLETHKEQMGSINTFHKTFLELYASLQAGFNIHADTMHRRLDWNSRGIALIAFMIFVLGAIIFFK